MSLRQQNKIRAKQQIINAADTLIAEKGVDVATTREIAKLAGVSYQTLYNYFPNKALILRELLNEEFATWSRAVDLILKSYDGNVIASMLEICAHGADMALGPKRELWHALMQQTLSQPMDQEQYSALSTIAHEHCYALLNTAQGMGHLKPGIDLHLLAHTLFSLCDYNLLMLHLSPIPKEQFLSIQQQQFDLVIGPYLI